MILIMQENKAETINRSNRLLGYQSNANIATPVNCFLNVYHPLWDVTQ